MNKIFFREKLSINYPIQFWVVLLVFGVLKILFALRPELDLFTEEAQYWLWSQNLDWHYYSKPPLIAILNFVVTSIFGTSEWAIRLVPIVFGMGTAWLVYLFARELSHSDRVAFWSGMIFLSMPITLLQFTFHTTDTSMTFFWTGTWYLFYRAIHSSGYRYWVLFGLGVAFGILSKYTMLLVYPASFLYLLFWRNSKVYWKRWSLFFMVSLLGFMPGLLWNFQHDFYTFHHLATLGGVGSESTGSLEWEGVLKRTSEYLGGQLGMISVFFLPFLAMELRKMYREKDPKRVFLWIPVVLAFLAFGALSVFKRVEVNWPGFSYVGLAIILGMGMSQITSKNWSRYAGFSIGLSLLLQLILLVPNYGGWKHVSHLTRVEKMIHKRSLGYEELGNYVQELSDRYRTGGNDPVILTESYHMASELSFYMPSHPRPFVIAMGGRKNQWDLWPGLETKVGSPNRFIFVSRRQKDPKNVAKFASLIHEEEFPYYFDSIPAGITKIQIWENLLEYNPVDSGAF